ncbi:hypothetical protein [Brevundimonas sp. TSRC1-1]|uniref:hypothetical protein n=1 Tax=Brevundimonas sp. TSRC1-1 TaxID=2804562 RepID=UPI003CE94B23
MVKSDLGFLQLTHRTWGPTWPGMLFTQAGGAAGLRLGETLRTIAAHPLPEARYFLTFVLIEALLASHGDVGVHSAVDRVWNCVVSDNYFEIEPIRLSDGRIISFDNAAGDSGDWEAPVITAVLRADAGQRATALEEVVEDVMAHRHNMTLADRIKLAES